MKFEASPIHTETTGFVFDCKTEKPGITFEFRFVDQVARSTDLPRTFRRIANRWYAIVHVVAFVGWMFRTKVRTVQVQGSDGPVISEEFLAYSIR